MIKKSKIDADKLYMALQDKGYSMNLWGGLPTAFEVYAKNDREQYGPNALAAVSAEQRFFGEYVSSITVYDKSMDEVFEKLLGLDYYSVRKDRIKGR